ncbi:MAG: hypothetical protein KAU35_08530 [candidate division Zixibacteria bacterium]|nr:hypothetical protein [candidate division Zixibacteria bacterium]
MTNSALPGTATYTDNLDGTGTFDWTPTLADSGSYLVTFYATDGAFPAVADSETITITVSNANQEPVLAVIGDTVVLEGANLHFTTSATDADGDIPAMTSSALPGTATYTDNLDGTGTFDWTPTLDDSGSYLVTFYATDGAFPAVSDSETITITVSNTNQEPVLTFIGTQTTPEGGTLDFTASATDPDGDTPFMSTSELPGAAAFVDNGNGTGTFTWVTTFLDAGTYLVTFYATDEFFPGSIDSEQVTIVVGEIGNQAPVWVPLNDTAVYEGTSLILNVSASDPDGDSVALSVNTTLGEYGFADNGDGSGVLTYQPTYADAGIDTVRFIATDDGSPQLSAIFEITVATYNINQPPEFEPTGPFTTAVNDTLVFTVTASDPTDSTGGRLYLSVLDGPANSQLVDNGDNTGTFTFAPAVGQAGIDTVIFLAVDDETPGLTGSLPVEITVLAINFPPVLNSIGPQAVLEGEVLVINASAIDPDGALPPIMSVDTVLENAAFVDNLDGTAVYTFSPNYVQAGLYAVTFEASDGSDSDQEIVLIQVNEAGNQAPVFDSVPSPSVVEADTLIDMVTGSDPDLDSISFTLDTATVPENFTLTDNGDGTASFTFTPSYVQAGIYDIGVIVSDGELADTAILTIDVVEVGNQKPALATVSDAFVNENENLTFEVFATDIDGPPPVLTAAPLPGTATFEDPEADGIGTFDWTPSYDDSGAYVITFYATDADFPSDIDSVQATITVEDVNRKPWYMIPFNQADTVFEGDILEYSIIAWDDDGSIPFIEAYVNGTDSLATNMTLEQSIDGLNRNGLLTFTPDHSQGDIVPPFYYVKFYIIDEFDASLMDSSETITFEVIDKNQYPYLETSDGPGPFDMDEGDTLAFWVRSHDDDGISTMSVENLPDSNCLLDLPVDSVAMFEFRPDYIQAGQYFVSFIAIDDNLAADTLVIEINVAEAGNQAPVWSTPLPDTIDVFVSIAFDTTVSATDPEGGGVILEATPIIPNASWDTANGEGIYAFTPAVDQAGSVYQVLFIATDELGVADTMITHFNVTSALRGDTDSDDVYTMNDVVFLAAYIFRSGPAPHPLESGDADMSGAVNVADIAYMINFLYNFGPRPPQ